MPSQHVEERDKEKLKNAEKGRLDKTSEREKFDEREDPAGAAGAERSAAAAVVTSTGVAGGLDGVEIEMQEVVNAKGNVHLIEMRRILST